MIILALKDGLYKGGLKIMDMKLQNSTNKIKMFLNLISTVYEMTEDEDGNNPYFDMLPDESKDLLNDLYDNFKA
jgi:hypothetical protein